MQRRTVIASMGAILGTSVGAAAYTSATVTRDATFTVATDASGALIGLTASEASNDITVDNGVFNIQLEDLNTKGTFTYGDKEDPINTYAFIVKNNDDEERTITIDYSDSGITFELYKENTDTTGAENVGTVTDGGSFDWTAAALAEVHVVMVVDTGEITPGSGASEGTLTFTATDPTAT